MRISKLFGKTSKTEGTDLTIDSHRLLVQAGFIRESTAGRYYLLPLGIKVHEKIVGIVRKHMDAHDAQEVVMPILHPLELWEETNRTKTTGFELMKITDRRGANFALGGTAEEMAVDLVRKFNISYKDLPFNIYQFSNKFRDEMRARGGLLRVREFVMKDGYSFSTEDQFKGIYQSMWDAYVDIYAEIGLEVDVVAADNGYIGGEYCHEFVSPSENGESRYFIEDGGDYAAHEDVAVVNNESAKSDEEIKPLEQVAVVRGKTMEAGAEVHGLPMDKQIKDVLFYDAPTDKYVLAIIRGDLDVNETKLMHAADAWEMRAATSEEIIDDIGSYPGYISPVNIARIGKNTGRKLIIVADNSLKNIVNMYGGANSKGQDLLNINNDRDYSADTWADIAMAKPGQSSPNGKVLIEKKGIEVGNIFQLGYHYSDLMDRATYVDQNGEAQKYYMGCYGIGIGRTLAAVVEKHHDQKGIVWPTSIAPYGVYIAQLGVDPLVVADAERLYADLTAKGISVLYDDRDCAAGAKFADADLMGVPCRIVVSKKTFESGAYEVKDRTSTDGEMLSVSDVFKKLGV
jgi:prolyl-tRNA synthetase